MRSNRNASAVDRLVHSAGIPLLVCSMVVTTAIAGIPGYFLLARAFGEGREWEALRLYAIIAFCTAAAEGLALVAGIFVLRRLASRINVLNGEIRSLVRNVLHDLRTPISHISGKAQLLMEDAGDPQAAAADILESCEKMLSIVNANVEITNNYTGAGEPPAHETDFSKAVSDAVELFSPVAEMKGVSLSAEITSRPVTLNAHVHKLQQLVGNLVDNAIKFTPSGGKVKVTLSETRAHAVLAVADNGVGIAEADQPRIYDRFFRADPARSTPGSGLGLSLVHAIVTFYGGSIDCASSPGAGTVFTVALPK